MSKIRIGKLEIEIPEATLGVVEDVAAAEEAAKVAAEAKDHDGLRSAYLGIILILAADANEGLDEAKLRRALPFRRQLEVTQRAYRDALVAARILDGDSGGAPGEAVSP